MLGIDRCRFTQFVFYPVLLFTGPGILLSACAGKTPAVTPDEGAQQLQEKLAQQTAVSRDLEEKVAKLQLHLLEQEAQAKELQKKLDEAIQEVVRAKAKLHTVESKAEAASMMAEAEIALDTLRKRMAGQENVTEVVQAEDLLKMSAQEFEKQNYGGALYLTSQAKGFIKAGEARVKSQENVPVRAGEVFFAVPVPLRVLTTSNVRDGPGLTFKVLFAIEKGTPLVGHSYKGQWVRVEDEEGRGGWIFRSLVKGL